MKMMRALTVFVGLSLASAHNQGKCALNGARAVDDMMDSAVYIMAAIVRCDSHNGPNADAIRCSLDIASSVEAVNAMINVILKAVDKCGKLPDHHKCGLAVGVLTKTFAGLTAASAGIAAKCPNKLNGGHPMFTVGQDLTNVAGSVGHTSNWNHGNALPNSGATFVNLQGGASFGQCIVNIKSTMKSLFKGIKRVMTVKDSCDGSSAKHCAHNDLKIVAAFVSMGEFLAGAIGKCTPIGAHNAYHTKVQAQCAQYSLKLVQQIHNVGRASIDMAAHCELTAAERLYLEDDDDDDDVTPATGSSSVTLGLAALLPITAVLSFAVGKRLAKARSSLAQDCESLVDGPEVE